MWEIDITENSGVYASKWGISDFYDEAEKSLREALISGKDFDTGWFGCKKEINYARIIRENGEITVSVCCYMDDLFESEDLIYDAIWKMTKSEKDVLPEEIIDSIRDGAILDCIGDSSTEVEILPLSSSFEDVVNALDKCEAKASEENDRMFNRLCEIYALKKP